METRQCATGSEASLSLPQWILLPVSNLLSIDTYCKIGMHSIKTNWDVYNNLVTALESRQSIPDCYQILEKEKGNS